MRSRALALCDCDAFYVSCERLFAASLRHRPVVVVGNLDGCIVARSREAKALALPMSAPLFHYQEIINRYDVAVFSSNYALYQDLSDRVMTCLAGFSPRVEPYSIDEAWIDLSEIPAHHLTSYARSIREHVLRDIGIPTSVGVASTKSLAKVACEAVKKQPAYEGVLNLLACSPSHLDDVLQATAVEDVWGIGKQWANHLHHRMGITHALALREADHLWIRRHFPVQVERIVLELRGIQCLPLQLKSKPRQMLSVSRTFPTATEAFEEIEELVATYAVQAAEKLRRQRQTASRISVFIATNPFDQIAPQYAQSAEATLPVTTAFTPDILTLALALLHTVYRPGYRYKRAGVGLSHLQPEAVTQPDLFGLFSTEIHQRQQRVMQVLDEINWTWGPDTLFYASQGAKKSWTMRQRWRSPRYTTRWGEILSLSES